MLNRLSGDGTVEIHCDDQAATTTTARESEDTDLTAAGQESVEQAVVQ